MWYSCRKNSISARRINKGTNKVPKQELASGLYLENKATPEIESKHMRSPLPPESTSIKITSNRKPPQQPNLIPSKFLTNQKDRERHKQKSIWNSLGIITTDLPEHGIRPAIPWAQSPQSLFERKPHLVFSQKGFRNRWKVIFFQQRNGVSH